MSETFSAGWRQRYFTNALKDFAHTSEWIHAISGATTFCLIMTDVLEIKVPNATLWALAIIFVTIVIAWTLGKTGKIAHRTVERIIGFMVFPAVVFSCLFLAHKYFDTPSLVEAIVEKLANYDDHMIRNHDQRMAQVISSQVGVPLAVLSQQVEAVRASQAGGGHHNVQAELQAFANGYARGASSGISTDETEARALLAAAESDSAKQQFAQARFETRRAAEMEHTASMTYNGRSDAAAHAATNALEHSAWLAERDKQHMEAAADFADGARLVASIDPHRAWQMTRGQAQSLYKQGTQFHDEASARQAVALCTSLATQAAQSHWDADLQAIKTDLDLANASLSAISGKPIDHTPGQPAVPHKPNRPIHGAQPGWPQPPPQTVQPVVEPQPNPPTAEAQPAEGFFARLTGWIGHANRGSSQPSRQVIPPIGSSRPVSAPISPPVQIGHRKNHGETTRRPRTSNR